MAVTTTEGGGGCCGGGRCGEVLIKVNVWTVRRDKKSGCCREVVVS